MTAATNDLWAGSFLVDKLGAWSFTVEGWIDHFDTWASDLRKRIGAPADPAKPEAGLAVSGATPQEIALALRSGAILIHEAARRARDADARTLTEAAKSLETLAAQGETFYENPMNEGIAALVARHPDLTHATRFEPELALREIGRAHV